ncbi:MAG: cell division topological specificity factor MinE [Anaerolineaceae bacterium]
MADWMKSISGSKKKSASDAKERLKLVLIHDRTEITPDELEKMKNELLEVISRHLEIDAKAVRIIINQEGREQRLTADIPLLASRHRGIG